MRWFVLALVCSASVAQARHTDRGRIIENSAYTLEEGEVLVGLEIGYGVADTLQISTYVLPWALGALPEVPVAPNANLKWRFYETESWAFGLRAGVLTIDTTELVDSESRLTVFPFELIATWRSPNWTVSTVVEAVQVQVDGDFSTEDTDLEGVGVGSTAMLELAVEWRRSDTFAWVLELRALIAQKLAAEGVTVIELDPQTTIEVHGDGGADLKSGRQANAGVSAFWSWDSFNLKAGLAYGHVNLPYVNFFNDDPSWFPKFDLFWRF